MNFLKKVDSSKPITEKAKSVKDVFLKTYKSAELKKSVLFALRIILGLKYYQFVHLLLIVWMPPNNQNSRDFLKEF